MGISLVVFLYYYTAADIYIITIAPTPVLASPASTAFFSCVFLVPNCENPYLLIYTLLVYIIREMKNTTK